MTSRVARLAALVKNGDVAFSVLLILIAASVIHGSLGFGFWDGRSLQAGFLPLMSGVLLAGLATLILIGCLTAPQQPREIAVGKPLLILVILLAAVLALPILGASLAVFLMMSSIFVFIERLAVIRSLVVAAIATACLHLIFKTWLSVPLPSGFLGL